MFPQVRAAAAFAEVKCNKRAGVGHPLNHSTAIPQMVNLSCKAGLIDPRIQSWETPLIPFLPEKPALNLLAWEYIC